MFIGLTALSYEFEWARRLRRWAHDEVQRRLRRPDA
jgi:hypothetical protein